MAVFTGSGKDDIFAGTEDADTITSGGGKDTLDGAGGNDAIVLDAPLTAGSAISGGAGTDTLILKNFATQPVFFSYLAGDGLLVSSHGLSSTTISSIERLLFQSNAGTQVSATFGFGETAPYLSQIGDGISANAELIGGAGRDGVALISSRQSVDGPSTIDVPVFTYTDWTTPDRAYRNGDFVSVSLGSGSPATINGSAHEGIQFLNGGTGDDTINGSGDMDLIIGGGGVNQLHGNGGDDTLGYFNTTAVVAGAQGQIAGVLHGSPLALGLFDGGDGFDFLAVGGYVKFSGSIQSIEGIYLSPAYTNVPGPNQTALRQDATYLSTDTQMLAELPNDLLLDGVGTIGVDLASDADVDGSRYRFDPGSDVRFMFRGNVLENMIVGTTNADTIEGFEGDDVLRGGSGDDWIDGGVGRDVAVFSGDRSDYAFVATGDRTFAVGGHDGNDTLTDIEGFRFEDGDYVWHEGALKPVDDAAAGKFRAFLSDGFAGEIGGRGTITGTNGFQDISLTGAINTVTFDPSFNRGGDVIRVAGPPSSFYSILRSGSSAVLASDVSSYTIPVGNAGVQIRFGDDPVSLAYDPVNQSFKIGNMYFGTERVLTGGGGQIAPIPGEPDPTAIGRVFLEETVPITIGGDFRVFGTSEAEAVTWRQGNIVLDPSFNRGGDRLIVAADAKDFSAYRSGSSVVLLWGDGSATIPVGSVGITLEFDNERDSRLLRFDQVNGGFLLGAQLIDATSAAAAIDLSAYTAIG